MVNLSLSDTPASLSDDDIIAPVGPATWANGMRLAASGAVKLDVMGYEQNSYYSAGAVDFQTMLQVEN